MKLFTFFMHCLNFKTDSLLFLWAQIQTPGVKWYPWLCLIIQSMFPAQECACKSIFCLYLWMLYLTGHKLRIPIDCPIVPPLWRVASTKFDSVPWPPLALVLRLYNFQNCHSITFLNGISAYIVLFFINLQNKWLWPTNVFLSFFREEFIVRHTASADLRWNGWKWKCLTLDNSKMYLWQVLKASTKSSLF